MSTSDSAGVMGSGSSGIASTSSVEERENRFLRGGRLRRTATAIVGEEVASPLAKCSREDLTGVSNARDIESGKTHVRVAQLRHQTRGSRHEVGAQRVPSRR